MGGNDKSKKQHDEGYGLFTCGNCHFFNTPDRWTRAPEKTTCQQQFDVTKDTLPCPAMGRGTGYYKPMNLGALEGLKNSLSKLKQGEIHICRVLLLEREEMIEREGITNFRIDQKVKFNGHDGGQIGGLVTGLTRSHVKILGDDGTNYQLLPGNIEAA
jgi:hypothetical protein